MGGQQTNRKFDSQAIQLSIGPSHNKNTDQKIKLNNADAFNANSNIPDYFRLSMNRAADKRASQVLTEKIHNEFSDFFHGWDILKTHLGYR